MHSLFGFQIIVLIHHLVGLIVSLAAKVQLFLGSAKKRWKNMLNVAKMYYFCICIRKPKTIFWQ
jgi:hypothetical protein